MKKLNDKSGIIILKGQHSVELPVKLGMNSIRMTVRKGKIQLNHGSFTPDGGTWLMPPSGGRKAHYLMKEGNMYDIDLEIRENYGKPDRVNIINILLFKIAEFEYSIE